MNLRKHKQLKQIHHAWRIHQAYWQRVIDEALEPTPEDRERQKVLMAGFWESLEAKMSWKVLPETLVPHLAESVDPTVMKSYNNMLLSELVEPTGIAYLNEQDQLVAVPMDSDAGRIVLDQFSEHMTDGKFIVAKKTTGEVVGEFDVLDDAKAMVDKAKRAKKQALVVL